jgi:GntR family transcriptional regulator/MocR family aminotransferase
MHPSWNVNFRLERMPGKPLYRQVATTVMERVGNGILAPGSPLPGTRTLARSLGVHRNTIKAAYDDLMAAGWVSISPSRGTFISHQLPARSSDNANRSETGVLQDKVESFSHRLALTELTRSPEKQVTETPASCCVPAWNEGLPDARLAPVSELGRALRRALKSRNVWASSDEPFSASLRAMIAETLRSSCSIPAVNEEILLTRSPRMSLHLIARTLLSDRATIAVEHPGNRAAIEIFEECGLNVLHVPVDRKGILVDRLANYSKVEAVYVTPRRQYPTTVCMAPERREQLLQWSRTTGGLIIEDDYDAEFEFDGLSMPPLAAADARLPVIYMAPCSRIFSPAVEPGYIRATRSVISRLSRMRSVIGCQSDRLLETAFFELTSDGVLRRHLRRVRSVYRERRDQCALSLKQEFGNRISFTIPHGGLAIWVNVVGGTDSRERDESAQRFGNRFVSTLDGVLGSTAIGGLRLGFAAYSQNELATRIKELGRHLSQRQERILEGSLKQRTQFRRCIA